MTEEETKKDEIVETDAPQAPAAEPATEEKKEEGQEAAA